MELQDADVLLYNVHSSAALLVPDQLVVGLYDVYGHKTYYNLSTKR